MKVPDSFENSIEYWKLNKAIYELKQEGRIGIIK